MKRFPSFALLLSATLGSTTGFNDADLTESRRATHVHRAGGQYASALLANDAGDSGGEVPEHAVSLALRGGLGGGVSPGGRAETGRPWS